MKKVLEIIVSNISPATYHATALNGVTIAAKEIHDHYMKFMEWAVREQHLIYSGAYEEWQTRSMGSYLTLDELHQYYCDKIL